ncbi:MAG TPA: hypothetical protein VLE43_13320 [Candidatus Saccharimonadia bacterium]|nr:hypothetical protein [Candidatus Saccharimonadia bacterium]
MKTATVLLLSSVLLTSGIRAVDEPEHPPANANPAVSFQKGKVREMKISLLDEAGSLMPAATVELYSMERGGRSPDLESTSKEPANPWWTFTTDNKGMLVARFPVTHDAWDESVPNQGDFYFVAQLPDGRKAMSPRIFHDMDREAAREYEPNEWEATQERVFTDETGELTMQLTKGHTITGVLLTTEGKPLGKKTISATHDLHIQSHTGYGGDIFSVKATTGEDGRFTLEHVYPVDCTFAIEGEGHWARTQVTLKSKEQNSVRWVESAPSVASLPLDTSISLKIEVAPKAPTYRYHGQVVDGNGKPLPGLVVTAGVSFHDTPETYADSHHFDTTTTDASGHWTLDVESPWVRFLDVRIKEHEEPLYSEDYESDDVGLAAPGEYNFKVTAPIAAGKTP